MGIEFKVVGQLSGLDVSGHIQQSCGYGRATNMKTMELALVTIFFMTYFDRRGGGGTPP